jgi:membrane-associated protein
LDFSLLDIFLHLDQYLALLVNQYGVWVYAILFLVVFCETGLVVTPFLPGDSLLFVAGAVAATGGMNPYWLSLSLFLAAVLGDSTNYWIGRLAGERLFANPDSRLFRRDRLEQAHGFFETHGGKTVAIARFVPMVRTFAPFVAGMARMAYGKFLLFSVTGTLVWVGSLVTVGYLFGNIEFVRRYLSVIVLSIVALTMLPVVIRVVQVHLAKRRQSLV